MKALRKHKVQVWIIERPVDLLTKWAGLFLPLEVKPEDWDGEFSSEDQRVACEDHGVPVVQSPEEALRAVGVI